MSHETQSNNNTSSTIIKGFMRILFILMLAFSSSAWSACEQTVASGGNVLSAVTSAAAGTEVCLAVNGTYSLTTFNNIVKTSDVTIKTTTGSTASMAFVVSGGSKHLKFSNLTIPAFDISGQSTTDITVQNSIVTGQVDIVTTDFNNNNILIKSNTFNGINAGDLEGRLNVRWPNGPGSVNSGVTIDSNYFGGGGCSDGIQIGAYGVVVTNNTFEDIVQASCSPKHIDAIQGYGQSHSTITGNIVRRSTVCIGYYDGGSGELVTNNVFLKGGSDEECKIDFGQVAGLNFEHNQVTSTDVRIGYINDCSAPTSGTIKHNVFTGSFAISDGWTANGTYHACGAGWASASGSIINNLYPSTANSLDSSPVIGTAIYSVTPQVVVSDWILASTSPGYSSTPRIGIEGTATAWTPPSGLVAWYKLDTDFTDSSTKTNHGIANGTYAPQPVTDVDRGNVMHFDGNDLVTIPFDPIQHLKVGNDTKFTVCAFHKPDNSSTNATNLVTRLTDRDNMPYVWALQSSGGVAAGGGTARPYGGFHNAANNAMQSVQGGAIASTWQHICLGFDSTQTGLNEFIYVDGALNPPYASASRGAVQAKTSANGIVIGSNVGQAGNLYSSFAGNMADVMIFDRLLSATEVLQVRDKAPN